MSRGGVVPKTAPVGWVFLNQHREGGITIRWCRGDTVAYVLRGCRIGEHMTTGVLDTILVTPTGWTDLAEVRLVGRRWVRQQPAPHSRGDS